jgi:uncharacterized protein YdhG (YjbR/CyaY superfamily)
MSKPTSIDEYLEVAPAEGRAQLRKIRRRVRDLVPDAEETISYGMPAFRLGKVFIYFAAFKHHVGIYPPVIGDKALVEKLRRFRGPKGNLKFAYENSTPDHLIDRIVLALVEQINPTSGG